MDFRNVESGFTLIELLVVIAIIAVLAAMLLPALSRSKKEAQSTVCKNHLRQMQIALRLYVDDSGCYPYYDSGEYQLAKWEDKMGPYYQLNWTNSAYHCPGYTGAIIGGPGHNYWLGSYSYNAWGVGEEGSATSFGLSAYATSQPQWKDADIMAPSEMFAIMDTQEGRAGGTSLSQFSYTGYDWTFCNLFSPEVTVISTVYGSGVINFNTTQHGKLFNVGFCDAHVSAIPIVNLFNPLVTMLQIGTSITYTPTKNAGISHSVRLRLKGRVSWKWRVYQPVGKNYAGFKL